MKFENIQIRIAQEKDRMRLFGYWLELSKHWLGKIKPAAYEKLIKHQDELFSDSIAKDNCLVADIGYIGTIGYALFEEEIGTIGLKQLYANKHFRGQGIGTKLIKEIAERAACIPVPFIKLKLPSCSEEQKIQARAFYESLGFKYVKGDSCETDKMICRDLTRILEA